MINVKAYCKAAFLIFKYSALVSLQHQGKKIHQIKANKNRYQSIIFKGYYEYLIYSPKNKQYNNHHIWPIFFHEFHCSIFIYYSDCSYTFQLNQALPQK